MPDPPRRYRPEARKLLFAISGGDSVSERDRAWSRLAEIAKEAAELTKVRVEAHHLCVLIALAELTPPAEVTEDTDEDDAPTQASIAVLTGYKQPWVSEVLYDLYADPSDPPTGWRGSRLVRRIEAPHGHLEAPHKGRDMYWLTIAGDELLTTLFP
jgi:hypothetical protein